MVTPKKVNGSNIDKESAGILYDGANLSQLGTLFGSDHRVIVEKLSGVQPDGPIRNGVPTYKIRTAAPYLVKPQYEIEEYIKKMSHTELPKMLSKEFWAGQRSRQEYLLKDGMLWPTEKVIENVGELMKIFKNSARLFVDAVDRQSELNDQQKKIIKGLADGMLTECHLTVVEKFKAVKSEAKNGDEDEDDEL